MTPGEIKVANAPCSWGVLEFDLEGEGMTCERVLSEMARAGYVGTELGDWGFMPTTPAALGELLARHRLELVGAYVPVPLCHEAAHTEGVAQALRTARLVAAVAPGALVVLADDAGKVAQRVEHAGRIRPDLGLDHGQWATFARGAERIARAVRDETGLRTVFHHHCAGYVETADELAALMERTDPDLLGLCLDTGHLVLGGGDPLEALALYGRRIWHVHLKDFSREIGERSREQGWDYFRSVKEGVFCELGRGAVDFSALVAALRRLGYEGWAVVEQDVLPGMGTPLQSAHQSRAYLQRVVGL
jgi:inosose dehydratase